MLDVVQAAQMYRGKLNSELARVEEFLRFADRLNEIAARGPTARTAPTMPSPQTSDQIPAAHELNATAAKPGAEAGPTDPASPRADGGRSIFDGLKLMMPVERRTA